METIVRLVRDANPTRSFSNIARRVIKLGEEFGEISEAYLNVTSAGNGKGMTWADFREEAADFLIVSIDVALTVFEGEQTSQEELTTKLIEKVGADVFVEGETPLETTLLVAMQTMGNVGGVVTFYHQQRFLRSLTFNLVAQAFELARRATPDQEEMIQSEIDAILHAEVVRKLDKWTRNRDTGRSATDAE